MDLQPLDERDPRQIGKYTIVGRLGRGGMGHVYLGRTQGGRDVALKVIREEFANDAEFRKRFRTEVAAARLVNGVYTAGVLDADPDAVVPWMATAFVAGPSLHQVVQQQRIPERQVMALAAALAEALVSIHEVGVIHRDLKPSNVIMAPDGPRVIDFGIARAAETAALTGSGVVIGTPGFMAPEQVTGGQVAPKTDVFALGAVLAYSAMGVGPFGQGPSSSLLYRAVHQEPDLKLVLDRELRELVLECLHKDQARRPTPQEILARTGSSAASGARSTLPFGDAPAAPTVPTVPVTATPTRRAPDSQALMPRPAESVRRRLKLAGWVITGTAATGTVMVAAGLATLSVLLVVAVIWGPDVAHTVWHWVPDVPGIDL